MGVRSAIFGTLSGIHLIGLAFGPMGYPITPLAFPNLLFLTVYLATVIVLDPLHTMGLPVFVTFRTTFPEPTLFGSILATLIWLFAYFGIAYVLAYLISLIRKRLRANSAFEADAR